VDSEDSMWGLCQWNLVLMSSSVYTYWCTQPVLSFASFKPFVRHCLGAMLGAEHEVLE